MRGKKNGGPYACYDYTEVVNSSLRMFTKLTHVHISNCQNSKPGWLTEIGSLTVLKHLAISSSFLLVGDMEEISKSTTIETLLFDRNYFATGVTGPTLALVGKICKLVHLEIHEPSRVFDNDAAGDAVITSLKQDCLRRLDFSGCIFSDHAFGLFCSQQQANIEVLNISNCGGISDDGFYHLSSMH